MLAQNLQHPLHHRSMRVDCIQPPRPRHRRMIRRWLDQIVAQKFARAEAVGRAPRDAAFRIDALEVTQQLHPEVRSRSDRRTARTALVVLPADRFDAMIKLLRVQNRVEPLVKYVPRSRDDLARRHPQILLLLPILLAPHAHADKTLQTESRSHVLEVSTTGC